MYFSILTKSFNCTPSYSVRVITGNTHRLCSIIALAASSAIFLLIRFWGVPNCTWCEFLYREHLNSIHVFIILQSLQQYIFNIAISLFFRITTGICSAQPGTYSSQRSAVSCHGVTMKTLHTSRSSNSSFPLQCY